MSGDEENGGSSGASALKTVLLVAIAIVAGFYGLKLTAWALKMLLWVAAVGAVGYLGYRGMRKLTSDRSDESGPKLLPRQLPSAVDEEPRRTATPLETQQEDINRQLDELKRRLEEED